MIKGSTGNFGNGNFHHPLFAAGLLKGFYHSSVLGVCTKPDWFKDGRHETIYIKKEPVIELMEYIKGQDRQIQNIIDEQETLTVDYAYIASHAILKIDQHFSESNLWEVLHGAKSKKFATQADQTIIPLMHLDVGDTVTSAGAWTTNTNVAKDVEKMWANLSKLGVPGDERVLLVNSMQMPDLNLSPQLAADTSGNIKSPFVGADVKMLKNGALTIIACPWVPGAGTSGDPYKMIMMHKSAAAHAVVYNETEHLTSDSNKAFMESENTLLSFGYKMILPEAALSMDVVNA